MDNANQSAVDGLLIQRDCAIPLFGMTRGTTNYWFFKGPLPVLISGLVFFILFILSGFPEGYCYFWPSIGTRFAKGYSEKKFEQVQPGMSFIQVSNLLGAPLCACPDSTYTVEQWFYTLDKATGPDFAWLVRKVDFTTNGFVLRTVKRVAYD